MSSLARAPSDSRAVRQHASPLLGVSSPSSILNRQQSVSRHYYAEGGAGQVERELLPEELPPQRQDKDPKLGAAPLPGDRLILTVQQNSLLPLVVAKMQKEQ